MNTVYSEFEVNNRDSNIPWIRVHSVSSMEKYYRTKSEHNILTKVSWKHWYTGQGRDHGPINVLSHSQKLFDVLQTETMDVLSHRKCLVCKPNFYRKKQYVAMGVETNRQIRSEVDIRTA